MTRLAFLIGRGSRLPNLLERVRAVSGLETVLVLSHKKEAPGLAAARELGVQAEFFRITDWYREHTGQAASELDQDAKNQLRSQYMTTLARRLTDARIDLVFMTGWDLVLGPTFFEYFSGAVMNVHPSLLPAFPGEEAWVAALTYGVKVTGVTIHFVVDAGIDSGPVILQKAVAIAEDETEDSLRGKLNIAEDEIGPRAIELFATGRLEQEGRRVSIS
ncbi:phosphoribosylglycinamide formyltransferase [Candidatus Parcubacteria bacterium]|nr:phosphoribosylglycinamide formyltransferase [Candidatus Parcubacteria bacterium]